LLLLFFQSQALAQELDMPSAVLGWEVEDVELTPPPKLEISPAVSLRFRDAERFEAAGFLLIGGTFDAAVAGSPPAAAEELDHEAELRAALHADGLFVEEMVKAALAAHRSADFADTLETMAVRARLTGLVPELKLRLAREVAEDQSLAPTEYDPDRLTLRGGVSTWLEARASFNLDHLVFSADEPGLLKLSLDRAKFERELVSDLLTAFTAWQKAKGAQLDPLAAENDAWLAVIVEEAKLDALTGGWFSQRRSRVSVSARAATRSEPKPAPGSNKVVGERDPSRVALGVPIAVSDLDTQIEPLAE
jgi:hypothetical protein